MSTSSDDSGSHYGQGGAVEGRCRVLGCTKEMALERKYYQRHMICEEHLKSLCLLVDGQRMRFCQQCARLHNISQFEGTRRSCRVRLKHRNKRRHIQKRQRQEQEEAQQHHGAGHGNAAAAGGGAAATDRQHAAAEGAAAGTPTTGSGRGRGHKGAHRSRRRRNPSDDAFASVAAAAEAGVTVIAAPGAGEDMSDNDDDDEGGSAKQRRRKRGAFFGHGGGAGGTASAAARIAPQPPSLLSIDDLHRESVPLSDASGSATVARQGLSNGLEKHFQQVRDDGQLRRGDGGAHGSGADGDKGAGLGNGSESQEQVSMAGTSSKMNASFSGRLGLGLLLHQGDGLLRPHLSERGGAAVIAAAWRAQGLNLAPSSDLGMLEHPQAPPPPQQQQLQQQQRLPAMESGGPMAMHRSSGLPLRSLRADATDLRAQCGPLSHSLDADQPHIGGSGGAAAAGAQGVLGGLAGVVSDFPLSRIIASSTDHMLSMIEEELAREEDGFSWARSNVSYAAAAASQQQEQQQHDQARGAQGSALEAEVQRGGLWRPPQQQQHSLGLWQQQPPRAPPPPQLPQQQHSLQNMSLSLEDKACLWAAVRQRQQQQQQQQQQ
ncbi:hypothetical protein Vafri_11010, partial [Volvox africanus]